MDWDAHEVCDELVQHLIEDGEFQPALEALVRGYQHLVVRYCTAMLGDTGRGEEVAQEVFLGAYQAMPRFRQQASVRTWLFAIAHKQCFKALRDRSRRKRIEEERREDIKQELYPTRVPGDDPDEQSRHLWQALDKFDRDERGLVVMRYFTKGHPGEPEGLPLAEIATILGRSEASVRRQLVRALAHLREVIEREIG